MIEKLTKEQEDKLPEYRDKYIAIGLDTDSFDKAEAVDIINELYRCGNHKPPKTVVMVDSPFEAVSAGIKYFEKKGIVAKNFMFDFCYGNQAVGWLSFYAYCGEVLGIDISSMSGLMRTLNLGWFLPYDDVCFVSQKPKSIILEDTNDCIDPYRRRLHSENGPSLTFRDGTEFYYWRGINVDKKIIVDPSSITIAEIQAEQNAEKRRVMIKQLGYESYLKKGSFTLVDESVFGKLFVDGDGIKIVEVINGTPDRDGSFKKYFIPVHPDSMTAHDAVARTYKMTPEQYAPQLRT